MFNANVDDAELDRRRSVLRGRGVPEAFIENLATRRDTVLAWRYAPLVLVFFGCALAVTAFMVMSRWQAEAIELPAAAALYARGAVLVSYAHWQSFALLPALLGLFVLPLWLFQLVTVNPAPYPAANVAASWLRSPQPLEEKQGVLAALPQSLIRRVQNAEDLLRAYNGASLRIMTLLMVPCFIVSLIAYLALANQYWAVMPDRIVAKGFGAERAYLLKDATALSLGCNHARQDSIKYVLRFNDHSFDIAEAGGELPPQAVFARLEEIDASVRSLGIPRQRWKWGVRDPMAPECLGTWSVQAGPGGDSRLSRLLQAP